MKKIKLFFTSLKNYCFNLMVRPTERSTHQLVPFGVLCILTSIPFYFFNLKFSVSAYENLPLRIISTLLCIGLVLKNYWPKKLKNLLPIYWYITLLYMLPFFFFFMTLKNNMSTAWQINMMLLVLFLVLFVDWISFIVLIFLGFLLAYLAYFITTPHQMSLSSITHNQGLSIFIYGIIIYALFSRNKQKLEDEKLATMRTLGSTVAHELRTPLGAILSGAEGLKNYFPALLEAYKAAKSQGIQVQPIPPQHYQVLPTVLDDIAAETKYSNNIIDMLLMNSNQSGLKTIGFGLYSMDKCIEETLHRYPFKPGEAALVRWKPENDFIFWGDNSLMMHVLFNLLKNALYFIEAENKGIIEIHSELREKSNVLYFKDSAKGIPPDAVPRLFERFYTSTFHGTGLGLAFCQRVIVSFKGTISCTSKLGEFTQFEMTFPKH